MTAQNQMASDLSPIDPLLLAWAEYWYPVAWKGVLAAGLITAIGACAGIVFLLLQWRTSSVLEQQSEWRTSALEVQAKRADADLAGAKADIASADARAADANARALEAQLALEKFKAPRTLTSERQTTIAAEMKRFSGTPFVLGVFQEQEALALQAQIESILTEAGWVEQEWKSGGDIVAVRPGRPNMGYTFVTGLYVQADNSHAPDFGPIVEKLAKLLSDAGIEAKPEIGRMAPNTNNDAIKILIGQKPR